MKRVFGSLRKFIARHSHLNWALLDQALISGVNFFTGILLARYLGLDEFGVFSLAWMAVLFANSLQDALIISPMMSIGAKQTEKEAPDYFGAVFVQQIFISLVSGAFLLFGARLSELYFPQWKVGDLALPLAMVVFSYQMQDFMRRYFFTRGSSTMVFIIDMISYAGKVLLLVWMFYKEFASISNVLWIIAITYSLGFICGLGQISRISWAGTGYFKEICERHWKFAKWLVASALLRWTSVNIFSITVAAYLGASAVGAMRASKNIVGVAHILFIGLQNIATVRTAKLFHEEGIKPMVGYLWKLTLFGGVATALICLAAGVAPGFWLTIIYREELSEYKYILQWYAVLYLIVFFNTPLRSGLRALEHTQPIFWANLGSTLFSILSATFLVSRFGLTGAMLGMLIAGIILQSILAFALIQRISEYNK